MQISIKVEDRSSLRFLWDHKNVIRHYQFSRLIFGATCSPFCAIYILQKCAKDNIVNFPLAFKSVKTNFYMDDYIHSASSPNDTLESAFQTKAPLQQGGFRQTKFESNSTKVLNGLPASEKETPKPTTRVLGQRWNLTNDKLYMEPPKAISGDAHEYTQRKLFSLVSSIFDPLGILAPVTILFKAILQSTWKLGNSWDSLLPANSQKELQKLLNLLVSMKPIILPRTLSKRQLTTRDNVQHHMFTDASSIGMSAVVYVRVEYQPEKQLATHYVIGKSKVAPIKQLSIPKLELEAAIIGFRLVALAKVQLQLNVDPDVHMWTDSQVVFDWINSKKKQKSFVSNCLAEINATQENNNWHHISTHLNHADHGTRGLKPIDIESKWLAVPSFLMSEFFRNRN